MAFKQLKFDGIIRDVVEINERTINFNKLQNTKTKSTYLFISDKTNTDLKLLSKCS